MIWNTFNRSYNFRLTQKSNPFILENIFETANLLNRQNYKILLLGPTGSGKTSFLDFFANLHKVTESLD